MAQVHSRIPVQNIQRGERLVYDAMHRLPEDWVVFHSCKEDYLEDNRYVHYEADFVVLVPERGIVVIEVKDWPQIRVQNGRWQSRRNSHDEWQSHVHSPLEQANIALQKLMRSLARCACLPHAPHRWPEHRHIAILTQGVPDIESSFNLPFGSLYLCGAEGLQQLQQNLEKLFILNQPERMSARRVSKIKDMLAPSVLFHMSLQNYLQEMDATTAPILNLLPMLYESTGGIRVEGCAGTGKTVMACAEAARQAADLPEDGNHRILMLCFNHAMANELQQNPTLAEQAHVLQISTFHDFCIDHILQPRQLNHLVNYNGTGDRLPEATLQCILNLPGLPQFDSIFVDEAQDFRDIWWQLIQTMLRPGGRLYTFADKHQDLYNRYHQMPELPTRIRLNANLRNARQIAGYSRAMLPENEQNLSILPMTGAGIHLSEPADSPQERAVEIQRIIQQLTEGPESVKASEIVVLSPWRTTHPRCSLPLVQGLAVAPADETPAQAAERRAACRCTESTHIFSSTIKSFKGQEAAYIVLTDVIGLGESRGFDMKELYTACTRARYGLYIIPTSSGKPLVESFFSFS